jgi:diadenosine tetraphosphate (Ap4A) HIT family hydrolase
MESFCPFCAQLQGQHPLVENELAVAFADAFPVSPGHALIVPRRHEPDYFALSDAEQAAMWKLVEGLHRLITEKHRPDGYNIGLNAGEPAGQTIAHAHLHVIPRYKGDARDPRGGIRWVLPDKAPYWND